MFEELSYITLSGEKYPIRCDLLVLEKIQEEFGSINDFEEGLITWEAELDENGGEILDEDEKPKVKGKFPDMKTVNTALYFMVNEGEAILAEREGRKAVERTREELVRKADTAPNTLANALHNEFYRCFHIKNQKATENQEKETEK